MSPVAFFIFRRGCAPWNPPAGLTRNPVTPDMLSTSSDGGTAVGSYVDRLIKPGKLIEDAPHPKSKGFPLKQVAPLFFPSSSAGQNGSGVFPNI